METYFDYGSPASAVLSTIGGIFQNNSSLDAMREQQAFAAQQAQLNRDWQEKMWNKQNEYNTPTNQRSRLEAAGLNPYLMLGNNAGNAQTLPSGSAASGSGIPSFTNPLQGASDALFNMRLQQANVKKVESEAKINIIDALSRGAKNVAEIELMGANAKNAKSSAHLSEASADVQRMLRGLYDESLSFNWLTRDSRAEDQMYSMLLKQQDLSYQKEVYKGQLLQNAMDNIRLDYLPAEEKAKVQMLLSEAADNYASAAEHDQRKDNLILEGKILGREWIKRNNEAAEAYYNAKIAARKYNLTPAGKKAYEYSLEKMRLENEEMQQNISNSKHQIIQGYMDKANGFIYSIGSLLPWASERSVENYSYDRNGNVNGSFRSTVRETKRRRK